MAVFLFCILVVVLVVLGCLLSLQGVKVAKGEFQAHHVKELTLHLAKRLDCWWELACVVENR